VSFPQFEDIQNTFNEFWNATGPMEYTSMYGLADVWEGPMDGAVGMVTSGTTTILAVETYKDNVYVLQGGGISSWLKVITPDGARIYELRGAMILMTNSVLPKYFSMTVINENEVIAGYMYLNLEHQFYAPFGIDLAGIYHNPSFNISNTRVNSTAWLTSIRDIEGWHHILFSKASPDDCLPCETKKKYAKRDFSCREESYSRDATEMPGYQTDTLSYTRSGYGERLTRPRLDVDKCAKAMDQYTAVFNQIKVSPEDVGEVGSKISRYCPSTMYKNLMNHAHYSTGAVEMKDEYISKLLDGNNDIVYLVSKSRELVGEIGEFLYAIGPYLGDNDFTERLFRDTTWWAPVWFNANQDKLTTLDSTQSAYSLLFGVDMLRDFVPMLQGAGIAPDYDSSSAASMKWIIVGKEGTTPEKYSKNAMTYFSFPYSQCISGRKLFSEYDPFLYDGVCGVETRANGVIIWKTLYGYNSKISATFMSNDGVVSDVGAIETPRSFVPASTAPMAVSKGDGVWIIRDYYLRDVGDIDYVESTVKIGDEMETIISSGSAMMYANINEVTGNVGDGHCYMDGTLDSDWGRYDLDDGDIEWDRAWGNDGKQFDWIAGYSGYQIKTADRL